MRPSDQPFVAAVARSLEEWESNHGRLPGLVQLTARDCFIRQLVDSDRRRRYLEHFKDSTRLNERQADPASGVFNPFAAAVWHGRSEDLNEALWLVFLAVHFGLHPTARWRYVERVYGGLDSGRWDWTTVAAETDGFRSWLSANIKSIKGIGPNGFGNHRKYESLTDSGTGKVVESYIRWIGPEREHTAAFASITRGSNLTPEEQFDSLYNSMRVVLRFGRLARFDYLTTASRLGLISAVAGRPYLPGSTGPLDGARILFGEPETSRVEEIATEFGKASSIDFAVLEDALCNWQKNPDLFKRFRA